MLRRSVHQALSLRRGTTAAVASRFSVRLHQQQASSMRLKASSFKRAVPRADKRSVTADRTDSAFPTAVLDTLKTIQRDVGTMKNELGEVKKELGEVKATMSTTMEARFRAANASETLCQWAVCTDGAHALSGVCSTWTKVAWKGKLCYISALHCSAYYAAASKDAALLYIPEDLVGQKIEAVWLKSGAQNSKRWKEVRNDVVIIQVEGNPGDTKELEPASLGAEDLDSLSIVAGRSPSISVAGRGPVRLVDDSSRIFKGCYVFAETAGDPGNSGSLMIGTDFLGSNPKVLGVYFGAYRGNKHMQQRGIIVPLAGPGWTVCHPKEFHGDNFPVESLNEMRDRVRISVWLKKVEVAKGHYQFYDASPRRPKRPCIIVGTSKKLAFLGQAGSGACRGW